MDSNNNYALSIKNIQKQIEKLTMDLQDFDGQQDDKLDMLCDKLDELEVKVSEIQSEINASRNGKLIWKISDVQNARQKAIDEEEIALFSNTIYTGLYGYRLRAVAYLDGIASGKGTHLSLYITLEQGEFDALLKWPFKQKVFFTLLDQGKNSSPAQHRTEELLGDRSSTSFHRPKSESNPGWGFPKFISIEKLMSGTYIKDDCMFIKIEVEQFDVIEL
ncbi:TNF receptor-associated factor 3-like [Rhopilema esculentum]|uniref:TNF receptor-associated factor 3-like n=1 Tax=Rhopilema esculentum TaxID=499914 RepID=UPI0031DE1161